jgi:hypothetical protein
MVAGLTTGLLALTLYQPWVSGLFLFAPLPVRDVLSAAAIGLSSVVWFEAIKFYRRGAQSPTVAVKATDANQRSS